MLLHVNSCLGGRFPGLDDVVAENAGMLSAIDDDKREARSTKLKYEIRVKYELTRHLGRSTKYEVRSRGAQRPKYEVRTVLLSYFVLLFVPGHFVLCSPVTLVRSQGKRSLPRRGGGVHAARGLRCHRCCRDAESTTIPSTGWPTLSSQHLVQRKRTCRRRADIADVATASMRCSRSSTPTRSSAALT